MSMQLRLATAAVCSSLVVYGVGPVVAAPVLSNGAFLSDSSMFNVGAWAYAGTLPNSVNAGFRAENVDDPICVPFVGCFGGDTQYATGQRSVSVQAGASPAYSLSFSGNFGTANFEAWEGNLVSQSKGVRFDSDVNRVLFPSPGTGITNEHPIPDAWQGANGYGTTATSGYASFSQDVQLVRNYLNPGEGGCPIVMAQSGQRTGHCLYTGSYFKGGATLQAVLQGNGSIENTVAGSQSVTLDAKANRTTLFKVNNDVLFSGEIAGTASTFKLEEERVSAVDFSFNGNFNTMSFSVGADVRWDGSGETSAFDASYNRRVAMPDYVFAGNAENFHVEFRDEAQLSAGITGTDFYKANVLASAGVSSVDTVLLPVFQPVASGLLVVKDASTFNLKSPLLPIPPGGFTSDFNVFLNFVLDNDGALDLTLQGLELALFDDDLLFDDLLGRLVRDNLGIVIPAGASYTFGGLLTLSGSALRNASFLDGDFLELVGAGVFHFSDVFGNRDVNFRLQIPEPGAVPLVMLALGALVAVRGRRRVLPGPGR